MNTMHYNRRIRPINEIEAKAKSGLGKPHPYRGGDDHRK